MLLPRLLTMVHETPVESGACHPAERLIARNTVSILDVLEDWLTRSRDGPGAPALYDPHDIADLMILAARVSGSTTAPRASRIVRLALEHPLPVLWDAALTAAGDLPPESKLCDALDALAVSTSDARARRLASVLAGEARSSLLGAAVDST